MRLYQPGSCTAINIRLYKWPDICVDLSSELPTVRLGQRGRLCHPIRRTPFIVTTENLITIRYLHRRIFGRDREAPVMKPNRESSILGASTWQIFGLTVLSRFCPFLIELSILLRH